MRRGARGGRNGITMGTKLLDQGLPRIWSKTPVESDLHKSGREFTAQEVQFLDGLELGRNDVVGKMKHDRGIGHAGGPALKQIIKSNKRRKELEKQAK